MCSRTVHEHLSKEILCSCSFVKEMNLFMFVCVCLLILGNEQKQTLTNTMSTN
ncbi:hypothetical protein HanIR_Chr04g0152801 [Helianthus annuus]|nr:hypothetical protein HanIR_Chr04g0152801 [Helianthus annuus]